MAVADSIQIRLANLSDAADEAAVLAMLDMYARDEMGDGRPLAADVRDRLSRDLPSMPTCVAVLAFADGEPIGLALCFEGYSSFYARPLLNVHDLAVVPTRRRTGVGRALLQAVEDEARRRGCCRLTLEVRADNAAGQHLYRNVGFESGVESGGAMWFWKKPLV